MSSIDDNSSTIPFLTDPECNDEESDILDMSAVEFPPILADACTQTELTLNNLESYSDNHLKDENALKRHLFLETVLENNKSYMFWTGVPKLCVLMFLFDWIEPLAKNMKLWMGQKKNDKATGHYNPRKRLLTLYEEFILTLIRIRRGWDVKETAVVLGISPCQVSRIFTSWVNLLNKCFKPLLEWPSTDMVKNNMPDSFKSAYPSTRVVIDCSELFVQKPRSIDAQRLTYSTYKSHNTFKFLLGIAPSGQVTYLSKLFSGSISDRDIVVKSGFLNLVSKDDNVMADRGFNIRDLLLKRGAYLNIPAFSSGKQLSARAVSNSRKIASVRIHVERAMKRIKKFKILQGVIPLKLKNSMDQILLICSVLGNLQSRLVTQ